MKAIRPGVVAALVGLCLVGTGCQSTASEITLQNRTTADVVLVLHANGVQPYLVPACGRVVLDPYAAAPSGLDLSSTHPDVPAIPYQLGLIPDAPTIATIVITSDKIFEAVGPPPSLPGCAGAPPAASPAP